MLSSRTPYVDDLLPPQSFIFGVPEFSILSPFFLFVMVSARCTFMTCVSFHAPHLPAFTYMI